jgi:cytochrome c-type biogenesis protein CcmH
MNISRYLSWIFVAGVLFAPNAVRAVTADEMLSDQKLEARAENISKELRCVVCQNQSIDDSNAPLAHDMRVLVRGRIQAGDSDDQAKAYLVARYGNFVLLRPPLQSNTWILWFAPLVTAAISLIMFGVAFWRRRVPSNDATGAALSEAERKRLDEILGNS